MLNFLSLQTIKYISITALLKIQNLGSYNNCLLDGEEQHEEQSSPN
jgi:hypothetical protein